jgi:prepilin signal peptidase PulO-like enzyme (type II secretory pathway)
VFVVRRRSSGYPFGPFLAFGTVVAIQLSESLMHR